MAYIDVDKFAEKICNFQAIDEDSANAVIYLLRSQPTADVVPINEVYRLIAGHSNYNGDSILSALKCVTEGKKVKPIRPLADFVEIPCRCKKCRYGKLMGDNKTYVCIRQSAYKKADDYCSSGKRK